MKKSKALAVEIKKPERAVKKFSVASIGFGSMAGAICNNLRDSNITIRVGARNAGSASIKKAVSEGFEIHSIKKAVKISDCVLLAIPDLQIRNFFDENAHEMFEGKCLVLCHGLSFFYHPLSFPKNCDIILISPNAIANKLRENYVHKKGDYALCAVLRDHSKKASKMLKLICGALGIPANKTIISRLKDEVFSDLFAEQSLLVGGILAIILSSFETMCEAGLSEEAAYLSTFHEIKYIVESISELGIKGFLSKVSDVARVGSIEAFFESGLKDRMKEEFKKIYANIESHKFYNDFIRSSKGGKAGNGLYHKQLSGILNSRLCDT
ncbi:MAG TPA: NAD(P)-binding domain-containing protein [Candidatus Wallbacteria bacterium]|nr:NAD(P)-binding domain-containing protein [Candidatus Wallbacteria bacterium]